MKRGVLLTILIASVTSAAVTTLAMLALLPAATQAQIERTTAAGLTVVRSDGLPGVTADVRPTGGGSLLILGNDGKTLRAQLGAAGGPPGQPANAATVGLTLADLEGNDIARIGTLLPDIPIALQLRDVHGKSRILASLDQQGNPTIQLFDADGNVIWSAP